MYYLDYGEGIMNIYTHYVHVPLIVYIKCVLFFYINYTLIKLLKDKQNGSRGPLLDTRCTGYLPNSQLSLHLLAYLPCRS